MFAHQVAQWHGRFGLLKLTRAGASIPEAQHSSETEVDRVPVHRTYANDGSIEELVAEVCGFFDDVAAGKIA